MEHQFVQYFITHELLWFCNKWQKWVLSLSSNKLLFLFQDIFDIIFVTYTAVIIEIKLMC